MKKMALTAAMAVCASMMAAPSFASTMEGAYVNANLGATQFPGVTFKDANNNSLSMSSKVGLAGGLALGSQNNNLRMEIAANCWENRIKRAALHRDMNPNLDTNNGTGSIVLAMLNGYYDFTPEAAFTPYLGLGVGAARFRSTMLFNETSNSINYNSNAHASHNDIAYQAIVGAAWEMSPAVKANIDYRYLLTGPQRLDINNQLPSISSNNLRSNYQNHRISVGLTYYMY